MFNHSNLETLKQLIEAGIRCTNWDLKVFKYNDEDMYDDPSKAHHGIKVAPNEEDSFQVIIIPEQRYVPVKTVAGERMEPRTFFNIYTPKYEAGDPSVGEQAYYYIDPDAPYSWSFPSAMDTAIKVVSWIVEFELATVIGNEAEYLFHCELTNHYKEA